MKEWYDIEDNFMKHKDVISQLVFENGVTGDRQPLVTVAIPAYKRPGLLRDAVDSALCQEGFRDFEILIVDDYPSEDQEMQEYLSQLANITAISAIWEWAATGTAVSSCPAESGWFCCMTMI